MHLAGPGELTLRERAAWGGFAGLISGVLTGAVPALGGCWGIGVPAGRVWSRISRSRSLVSFVCVCYWIWSGDRCVNLVLAGAGLFRQRWSGAEFPYHCLLCRSARCPVMYVAASCRPLARASPKRSSAVRGLVTNRGCCP